MQESYSYTQRPEEGRTFTVTDIQRLTGASVEVIKKIAEQANVECFIDKNRYNAIVYSFRGMKQIADIYRHLTGVNEVKMVNTKKEVKTIEELRVEHPLVKDDRFFKLSFFPDVIPKCFSEE